MLEAITFADFLRLLNNPIKTSVCISTVKNSLDITQHAIDFANASGGTIVIGFDRNNLQLRGAQFDAKWLNAILVNECKPPIIFKLRELRKNGKIVYLVDVNEGIEKPYSTYTIAPTEPSQKMETTKQTSNTVIEREQNCLDFLQQYEEIANAQYRELNKVSHKTAHNELTDLINKGLLLQTGQGRTTKYVLNTEANRARIEQEQSLIKKTQGDESEAQKNLFGSTIDTLLKENTLSFSRTAIRTTEDTEHMDSHKTVLELPEDTPFIDSEE